MDHAERSSPGDLSHACTVAAYLARQCELMGASQGYPEAALHHAREEMP